MVLCDHERRDNVLSHVKKNNSHCSDYIDGIPSEDPIHFQVIRVRNSPDARCVENMLLV